MKIYAIGYFYDHDFVDSATFRSSKSFLDYDVIIIDFDYILVDYKSNNNFRGHKCLTDDDSVALKEDIKRRKFEIMETLKLGRTVVIFTPAPLVCYIDTGKREHSGTGKNRITTRLVDDINLLSILPIEIQTIKASGINIEFRGNEPFKNFWRQNQKNFNYDSYFKEPIGTPLFYIKGTDNVVGSYLEIEKGHIIFLPKYTDTKDDQKLENMFFKSLKVLIKEIKKISGDFKLPLWSSKYLVPEELKEKQKLQSLEKNLNRLLNIVSKQKELVAKHEEYKILYTGTGRALEVQVSKLFKELGFEVTEGISGRHDLILKYDNKIAVIEVKGVTKSAAEKHAAQLEKWVSEYYSAHGILPKGILVVNTYKDIPLKERVEDPFPDQMLKYAKDRNHCLITGLQLLGIFQEENSEKKKASINELFETVGVYKKYTDWSEYLIMQEDIIDNIKQND